MAIVHGTDFSTSATEAGRIASLIAARLREPLRIVHVVEDLGAEIALSRGDDDLYRQERARMRGAEAQARALGAEAEGEIVAGAAPDVLAARADGASLLVIGHLGRRAAGRWLVGSSAERLARLSPAPLLVVRAAEGIAAWLEGKRPRLGVVLGADRTGASLVAARALSVLTRLGEIEVSVVHVARPEHDAALDHALQREIEPELAVAGVPRERMTFRVCASGADADVEIASTADALGAAIVAVGVQARSVLERIWRRSVSRGVVHLAPMSVLVVPQRAGRSVERASPVIREVLVATDLSELGNRAIAHAMALLPEGGVLHLAYVRRRPPLTPVTALHPTIDTGDQRSLAETVERLEQLVPADAARRNVTVQVHVLEGDVPDALCAAAERLAVDAICMASRARSAVNAAVIGSATLGVLARSRRPVFVVRAAAE